MQHLTQWGPREPFPGTSGLGTEKGDVHLSLVVKSEGQRLQRSGDGDPGEGGSGLLLSLPFCRLQEPGVSSPGLGSHSSCLLAFCFLLALLQLQAKDSD